MLLSALAFSSLCAAAEVAVLGGNHQVLSVPEGSSSAAVLLVANDTDVPQDISIYLDNAGEADGAVVRLVPTTIHLEPMMTGVVPYRVDAGADGVVVNSALVHLEATASPVWPPPADDADSVQAAQVTDVQITMLVHE